MYPEVPLDSSKSLPIFLAVPLKEMCIRDRTYTEAAAAEMKERIGAAIEKELEEDPSSEHLKRQSALIHTAKITTCLLYTSRCV